MVRWLERGPWRLVGALLAVPAGAALQMQQPAIAGPGPVILLFALGAAAWLVSIRLRHLPRWQTTLTILAIMAGSFALTDWRAQSRLAQSLPAALEGRDLKLIGVVTGLPRISPEGTIFELIVEEARDAGQAVVVPRVVRLSWLTGWDGESLMASPPVDIVAGDRWQVTARLRRPHGSFNPHGFDLELWMFERGIGASGSVRPGAVRLGQTISSPLDRMRQRARDAVLVNVQDAQAAGVLAALAVGDQAAIDRQDWDLFRITGVAHLMSISGLHITMFAWLAAAGFRHVWRFMPGAGLWLPAPDAARWGGLLLAAGYAAVSGWGVPAQRTVWMLATVVLVQSLGRRWPWPMIWLMAGALVVLLDPWALLQPGFWLSFVAVGVLMASEPASGSTVVKGWAGYWRSAIRTQWVASVALAPLSMVFFQQVSVVGLVANIVAVPWVTLLVTPLSILGLLWPPLWSLGALCISLLMDVLALLAAVPGVQWTAAAAPTWAMFVGVLGGLLLVLPLPWRLRWLGMPLMLPLLAPMPQRPSHGEVQFVAVDVGQGSAVLVRTQQHLMVYDTGPRYTPQSDAGNRNLLPLLVARGESGVDRLVLSHRDTDHIGGAASLLDGIAVHSSTSSLEVGHPLLQRLPQHNTCMADQQWTWDGVHFEVLHPSAADYERKQKPNALSCVIRVTDRYGPRMLLTGDIEAEQEQRLVALWGHERLRAPLLLLPHHGSQTSSTAAFLAAVEPNVAVAQVAYRSRFGHPAPEVVRRVQTQGALLVRSDYCGAWTWPSSATGAWLNHSHQRSGESIHPNLDNGVCERERRRRYWHHPGQP